jgi:hypothetical protein
LWAAHWFPHLNKDPRIAALEGALPDAWRTGELCDPQILLQFPHTGREPETTFHLDEEPPWAAGRRYRRVVGCGAVPMARGQWRAGRPVGAAGDIGGARVGGRGDDGPGPVAFGGINRTGSMRYGGYF